MTSRIPMTCKIVDRSSAFITGSATTVVLTPPAKCRAAPSLIEDGRWMMGAERLWTMGEPPIAASISTRAIEYCGLLVLVGGTFLIIVAGGGDLLRLDSPHPGLTLVAAVLVAA